MTLKNHATFFVFVRDNGGDDAISIWWEMLKNWDRHCRIGRITLKAKEPHG